jgi:hypothetical protein
LRERRPMLKGALMSVRLFLASSILALAVFSPNWSEASWTKAESFEFSAKTSLKITDPSDAHVFVTIGNETKESTLPAIFPLPDADAYIQVKIVGKDGDTWSGKVEVKAHKQTVVKFTHSAAPAPAAAAPAHKLIGKMENWTHLCSKKERATLKFVAMKDGAAAAEATIEPNRAQSNVELAPGKYSVRIFKNGTFLQAKELDVTADGWVFTYGCKQ